MIDVLDKQQKRTRGLYGLYINPDSGNFANGTYLSRSEHTAVMMNTSQLPVFQARWTFDVTDPHVFA